MDWVEDIKKRASLGHAPVSGGRSEKLEVMSLDDLVFVPAQLSRRAVDYYKEKISSKTIIGKLSKRPLMLGMPIMFAGMSFGAVSKSFKIALARASRILGVSTNTGEGGMLEEERKEAKILIAQYSTGRFGVNARYFSNADAIEIKIGQGAKPGQGGLLPGEKVTREIAEARKVPVGKPVHSPPYHPDIKNLNDLKRKISWLKKITDGKPIIIKLGAGRIEDDLKIALKANPDVIAVDGHAGGTGAAPEIMLNNFGIPLMSAVVRARKIMDKMKAKQDLIVGGGINTGSDIAKCLALGADAVFMGFGLMVAGGCIYCRQCYLGRCPAGITTQIPKLEKKLNIDTAVNNIVNYAVSCNEEVRMAAGACGHKDVHDLCRNDLRSLSLLAEKVVGIGLA